MWLELPGGSGGGGLFESSFLLGIAPSWWRTTIIISNSLSDDVGDDVSVCSYFYTNSFPSRFALVLKLGLVRD